MAAVAFPPAGINYNAAGDGGKGSYEVPVANIFNAGIFRGLGVQNVAAVANDYPAATLVGLAYALSRGILNNPGKWDGVTYKIENLLTATIMGAVSNAVNRYQSWCGRFG